MIEVTESIDRLRESLEHVVDRGPLLNPTRPDSEIVAKIQCHVATVLKEISDLHEMTSPCPLNDLPGMVGALPKKKDEGFFEIVSRLPPRPRDADTARVYEVISQICDDSGQEAPNPSNPFWLKRFAQETAPRWLLILAELDVGDQTKAPITKPLCCRKPMRHNGANKSRTVIYFKCQSCGLTQSMKSIQR